MTLANTARRSDIQGDASNVLWIWTRQNIHQYNCSNYISLHPTTQCWWGTTIFTYVWDTETLANSTDPVQTPENTVCHSSNSFQIHKQAVMTNMERSKGVLIFRVNTLCFPTWYPRVSFLSVCRAYIRGSYIRTIGPFVRLFPCDNVACVSRISFELYTGIVPGPVSVIIHRITVTDR